MVKRGKIPSLLTASSGKPAAVIAKKRRTCVRCSNKIEGGSKCFEIPKVVSGFTKKSPHCTVCYQEILEQTRKDLEKLEADL